MITSSSDSVKLISQPAASAGHNMGKMIRLKMAASVAPRSFAASKIFLSKLTKRPYVVTITNGTQKLVCESSNVKKPSSKCNKVKRINSAAPVTISGDNIKI